MEMGIMKETLVSLAIAALLIKLAMGETHTVGAPNGGWDTGSDLQSWAKSQRFSVGDNLSFQYMPPRSVLEVKEADYNSCQTNKPLAVYTNSNTLIILSSPGKRYFICGIASHCVQGMKLEVETATSPPPPPPSTSPANPMTPPPSSTTPLPTSLSSPPTASPVNSPKTSPSQPSPTPSTTGSPKLTPSPSSDEPNTAPSKSHASSSPMVPSTEESTPLIEPSGFPSNSLSPSIPPQPPVSSASNDQYLHVKFPMGLGFGLAMILAF